MIDLKDLASIIIEASLLDDDLDAALDSGDKYLDTERAKRWSEKSKNKPWYGIQRKGLVLGGDFIIDDIDEEKYVGRPIKRVTGNLSISKCEKIESLEDLFDKDCTITGNLVIEDCPNFKSLKGCPKEVGALSITGCKNFKEIDNMPIVKGNVYLFKNGKKFNKDKVSKDWGGLVVKNIFCSDLSKEEVLFESVLFEAFKAPQLKLLMDRIKELEDKTVSREDRVTMKHIVGDYPWDKIEASDVSDYNGGDPEIMKIWRKHTSNSKSDWGIFFLMNAAGEIEAVINGKRYIRLNPNNYRYSKLDRWSVSGSDINRYEAERSFALADTVVLVDLRKYEKTYNIQDERRKARDGALALQRGKERQNDPTKYNDMIDAKKIRYYQDVADSNRKRYKEMLLQVKAIKAARNGKFVNYKTQIDDIFTRYTNLIAKILQNPQHYSDSDLSFLNSKISNSYGSSKYDLLGSLNAYVELLVEAANPRSWTSTTADNLNARIREKETYIENAIASVLTKLSELEAK